LQRALQRDFDAVEYANALGIAYIMQGQFNDALEWFEKVLVQNGSDAKVLNNIAVTQYNLGDVNQALGNYKKAVEAGNVDARFNLAMHCLKDGDYNRALELLNGETVDAYFGRGLVYMEQGEDEKALSLFKLILESVPHHAGAYYNMGFIATRLGRYEESLSYIRKGMEIEPNYDNERYHLSLDSAISEFGPYYVPRLHAIPAEVVDDVFKPEATTPEELVLEAENLLSKSEVDSALKKLDVALGIDPACKRSALLKAEILCYHKDSDEGIELLERYDGENPDQTDVLEPLARMLKRKGRIREAKEKYDRLVDLEPENLSWLNEVAALAETLGQEDEALSSYLKIYDVDQENVEANLRLLRIHIRKKEFDKATKFLQFLAESHQDDYEFNILAGTYWLERKEFDKALGYFDRAIGIDSSNPLPYYHSGLLNVQRGAFEAACENWKKALLLSPYEELANKIRHCMNLTVELSEMLEKEI
jgi:tetratricopeptide (TPR) repeat protein